MMNNNRSRSTKSNNNNNNDNDTNIWSSVDTDQDQFNSTSSNTDDNLYMDEDLDPSTTLTTDDSFNNNNTKQPQTQRLQSSNNNKSIITTTTTNNTNNPSIVNVSTTTDRPGMVKESCAISGATGFILGGIGGVLWHLRGDVLSGSMRAGVGLSTVAFVHCSLIKSRNGSIYDRNHYDRAISYSIGAATMPITATVVDILRRRPHYSAFQLWQSFSRHALAGLILGGIMDYFDLFIPKVPEKRIEEQPQQQQSQSTQSKPLTRIN